MTIKYGKLIRDNIPDIIKSQGKIPVTKVLSDDEYKHFLGKKLLEEVHEYLEDNCIEEFCDILEVMDAIKKNMNFTNAEIKSAQSAKTLKNGRFEKKLFLEEVVETNTTIC
ncbi:MAG: nucleoside triphosphate pyrophosphohydrolase [Defluviitaleaceae bacterium]|nr:nucleoside triphosphate pyrophosphohydrolase [Defluviitaleaceae bacterium]